MAGLNSYAVISSVGLIPNDTIATIKPPVSQSEVFVIPENARKAAIDFQVNSEISYFSFSNFVKDESRKIFYTAWLKEKEVSKLSAQTDSLRKSYSDSSDDQKEKISALILKAEGQMMTLNEEIPDLYEKARNEEKLYWQSASSEEKAKFQEKIKIYQDSIQHAIAVLNQQKVPDTITYYKAESKPVANAEPATAITYKIQVGAFKGKLPDTAAKIDKKTGDAKKSRKLQGRKRCYRLHNWQF